MRRTVDACPGGTIARAGRIQNERNASESVLQVDRHRLIADAGEFQ